MVLATSLVALLDARPQVPHWGRRWIESVFSGVLVGHEGWPARRTLCGWSVGTVEGMETLVQSRPVVRDRNADPIGDFLRRPSSCTLGAFASVSDSDESVAGSSIHVARFHRWLGLRTGASLGSDQRERLRETLPDFLARLPGHRNDTDTVFLRFLAELYATGITGNKYAEAAQIRLALDRVARAIPEGALNMMVSDGRTLAILHRGGTLLAFDPPPDMRPRNFLGVGYGAKLLLWHPDAPPDAPVGGAERVGEGVMSVDAANPARLHRDEAS